MEKLEIRSYIYFINSSFEKNIGVANLVFLFVGHLLKSTVDVFFVVASPSLAQGPTQ
jgi:hypothetical protein